MFSEIEAVVLPMLLAGEHPILDVLRNQFAVAEVADRQFSGVGFFTYLGVPASSPRLEGKPDLVLGDVYAKLAGLEHDAGFLLFIRDGALANLECFIVDEQWPAEPSLVRAFYVHPQEEEGAVLVESPNRDLAWTLKRR